MSSANELYIYLLDVLFMSLTMTPWILQDLKKKPKYLVTFTVGYDQRDNINAAVKKVIEMDYVCTCEVIFHPFILSS